MNAMQYLPARYGNAAANLIRLGICRPKERRMTYKLDHFANHGTYRVSEIKVSPSLLVEVFASLSRAIAIKLRGCMSLKATTATYSRCTTTKIPGTTIRYTQKYSGTVQARRTSV